MSDLDLSIDCLGGYCPVQGEGTVNGKPFYFRARGEWWRIGIGGEPIGSPEWDCGARFGQWPDAGWMTEEEAKGFIEKAARRYADGLPGGDIAEWDSRAQFLEARDE